jgi:hypothetical protein
MRNIIRLTSFTAFLTLSIVGTAYASVLHSVGLVRGVDSSVSYIEHYQMETPLAMPLVEWLPAVSGS